MDMRLRDSLFSQFTKSVIGEGDIPVTTSLKEEESQLFAANGVNGTYPALKFDCVESL